MTRTELRLAVLGDPVAHSLSPAMHHAALSECGLRGSYERVQVPAERLMEIVADTRSQGYAGFNITIPHKEWIVSLVDRVDDAAARIGAVNTVVAEEEGQSVNGSVPKGGDRMSRLDSPRQLIGYNTDATGLARIVEALSFEGERRALVLGAGGAARASVDTLLALGWSVTVANRTVKRAIEAFGSRARVLDLHSVEDSRTAVETASLIVNATSAGMNAPRESPLPASIALSHRPIVVELVYSPLETRLLREARAAGCRVVDGLELLAAQAADSFALWTGKRLSDSFFRQAAESALREQEDVGSVPGNHTGFEVTP